MQRRMRPATSPGDEAVDLGEYAAVLRRQRWVVLGVTGAVVALMAGYSVTRTPIYTAQASVLVQPASSSSQLRPDQLVSIDTEARVAQSAQVAGIARDAMDSTSTIPDLLEQVEIEVTPDTLVLDVAFSATDPARAADGANAFASAYLEWKRTRSLATAVQERRVVQESIDELREALRGLEEELADTRRGTPEHDEALLARDSVTGQIAVLTAQLAGITPEASPGEIIVPATPPSGPSSPNHLLNLAIGLFLGGFFALLVAFVRDRTDDRVSDRNEFEGVLGAPVLATIPHVADWDDPEGVDWLVTERQPRSPAAEAYRTLRTAVMALSRLHDLKLLAVASPLVVEGKTTTTAHVAAALSHADRRVLAISGDLRRPTLHRYFQRELGVGLSDVLLGEATLDDAIEMVLPNLWVLTAGNPPARPAELLQSDRMRELLAGLGKRFDFVLVDCPPVLGLADTLALAPFVDGMLLVARAEVTKRGSIVQAVDDLEQVGARVYGGVLNDASPRARGATYYGYSSYREPEGEAGEPDAVPRPEEDSFAGSRGNRRLRQERVPPTDDFSTAVSEVTGEPGSEGLGNPQQRAGRDD